MFKLSSTKPIALFSLIFLMMTTTADSDQTVIVSCKSSDVFPNAQCAPSTDFGNLALKTELGTTGDQANFTDATKLVVEVTTPTSNSSFDKLEVVTQEQLLNRGEPVLERVNGTVQYSAGEISIADLKQKDAIVLVSKDSLLKEVIVDVSAQNPGQNAGNIVIVTDQLDKVSITADGYHGKDGKDSKTKLALAAMSNNTDLVSSGIKSAYLQRRESDLSLPLDFDSTDINNYEASGLNCRADEKPYGRPGTNAYAYDNAPQGADLGEISSPLEILAAGKEQTKRAFCQRSPEVSMKQSCQAEDEYSFQAICRVKPEAKSIRFFKRDTVRWKRALCAPNIQTLMRRSIVRKARVRISIPNKKSFLGLYERRVFFDEASHVYLRNLKNPEEPDTAARQYRYNPSGNLGASLTWYSPFFRQDPLLPESAKIVFTGNTQTSNGFNDTTYPTTLPGDNRRAGAKLLYPLRGAPEDIEAPSSSTEEGQNTLYYFKNEIGQNASWQLPTNSSGVNYQSNGCMPVISGASSVWGQMSNPTQINEANATRAITYFQALDVNNLGFSEADLIEAATFGEISTTGCEAYEVTEAIVSGQVVPANWVLEFGEVDTDTATTRPLCEIGGTEDCQYPTRELPTKSAQSSCSPTGATPEIVGFETFLQYERDDACYVVDPRDPPTWLKRSKAVDLNKSADITDFNSPAFIDLREGSALDRVITEGDFNASELSSALWTKLSDPIQSSTVLPGVDLTKIFKPSPKVFTNEFIFPDSSTPANINSLSQAQLEDYCVIIPESQNVNHLPVSDLVQQKLVRATRTQKMVLPTGKDVAVASNEVNKTCPSGIRLDLFLSHVSRPTCPEGTATKLRLSRWSSKEGDASWKTMTAYEQLGSFSQAVVPEANYTTRSEAQVTRYDDLPTRILTRSTNEVHPLLFLDENTSFTGQRFPQTYGFEELIGGRPTRQFPGWTREKSLVSKSGAGISPDTFTPFDGITLFDRGAAWCNADAFKTLDDGSVVPGFGGRGIFKDAPKRMFEFDVGFSTSTTGGNPVVGNGKYVGVEIVSYDDALKYGVYGLNNSVQSIFRHRSPPFSVLSQNDLTPEILQDALSPEAFRADYYPNIGGRLLESCSPGEHFNEFGGYCHVAGSLVNSRRRVVERILSNGTREPWSFNLTPQKLLFEADGGGVITATDRAFFNGGLPLGNYGPNNTLTDTINVTQNTNDFLRLGLFRPMKAMTNEAAGVTADVSLNRPESLGRMMLSPGFVGGRASYCNQKFFMVAVPVPETPTIGSGGQLVSVAVDKNNYLKGTTYNSGGGDVYLPPLFIALQVTCNASFENDILTGTVVGLSDSQTPSVMPFPISREKVRFQAGCYDKNCTSPIQMLFRNGAEVPQITVSNIKETLIAGINSTTGNEEMEFLEIASPKKRNRASEWQAAGIVAGGTGGSGWRSIITTEPTEPSTQQDGNAKSCTIDGVRNGIFTQIGSNPIKNGHSLPVTVSCRSSGGGEGCALTEEELSLFTKTVTNSKDIVVTRPALSQYTPWSHELVVGAPKNLNFVSSSDFSRWTAIGSGRPEASVPSCNIFNAPNDGVLNRTTYQAAGMDGDGLIRAPSPDGIATGNPIIVYPLDVDARKSKSCLRWDSVTGTRCEVFGSTVEGSEIQPLAFGGAWTHVFTETKERVARDCASFTRDASGNLQNTCQETYFSPAESVARELCLPIVATAPLCRVCSTVGYAGSTDLCSPKMLITGESRREQCTDTTCVFPTNIQSLQVEGSKIVPGDSGEDGTIAGSATLFCKNCGEVEFTGVAGRGGRGSAPVTSNRSKTLTCLSWNNNPLNPVFSVRNLWSQPFAGGAQGKNGRTGESNGEFQYYRDLTPENLFLMGFSEFWLGQ